MKRKIPAFILILIGIIALGSGIFLYIRTYLNETNAEKTAEQALIKMKELIPAHSASSVYEGDADKEMPVLEINGYSFVGYIEIPEMDKEFPVQFQWGNPVISKMREGNIAGGNGVIETAQISFSEVYEGLNISFIDINGKEYDFIVDYIGDEKDTVANAKLIIFAEGMAKTIQIACIEK